MPPDLYFALVLIVKMAITAGFVLAATVTAERAGPLVGGLVSTLPIGAGPVYVFLTLDHDAHFIAQSAVGSLAINAVNAVFALVYALLAQKRSLSVSLPFAFLAWLVLALTVNALHWSFMSAAAANLIVLGLCLWLTRSLRHVPMSKVRPRWYELAMRAGLVAILVGVVVAFSFQIGPNASGILAIFPMVLISIMFILHRRAGGKRSAAVQANAILGLVGIALACAALHLAAEPLGSALALMLALGISMSWNLLIFAVGRRGISV